MNSHLSALLLGLVALTFGACTSQRAYDEIKPGAFHGSVDLRWVAPDKFVYIPNEKDPFYFERANGQKIIPQLMYTDGGTIPRILWNNPNYSPWGYAPAYLIHDWIFYAKPDELASAEVDDAAQILAEGIKTLMEAENGIAPNPLVLHRIRQATSGNLAEKAGEITPWYDYLPDPEMAVKLGSAFFQGATATMATPAAVLDDAVIAEDSFAFNPNDDLAQKNADEDPDVGKINLLQLFSREARPQDMERPESRERRLKAEAKKSEGPAN